ncbi:MAG: hypothetical protein JWO47_51 [Candidatus Saccharibacteria bacterium]|nr:hypothetical protein [Candidatus Saccharibacteria bacterium]
MTEHISFSDFPAPEEQQPILGMPPPESVKPLLEPVDGVVVVPVENEHFALGFESSPAEVAQSMIEEEVIITKTGLKAGEKIPTLEESFSSWHSRLDRLEAEINQHMGTNERPQWYDDEPRVFNSVLSRQIAEKDDYDSVAEYFTLLSQERRLEAAIRGKDLDTTVFNSIINVLGEETVCKAFARESTDGILHGALLENVAHANTIKDSIDGELRTLKNAYGLESATQLLGMRGDTFSDFMRPLLQSSNGLRWIKNVDNIDVPGRPFKEDQKANRRWIAEVISNISGMDVTEAENYAFSASRGFSQEDIDKVVAAVNHFGADRIRTITEATGILGLEDYSIEQLERMERFAVNPTEVARELQEHDVTVTLINRVGDYGTVMRHMAEDVEDGTGRDLFFEITELGDIYRYMTRLAKHGIKPSTLVLGAHTSPGEFAVSDLRDTSSPKHRIAAVSDREFLAKMNEDQDIKASGNKGYSMHGMKGMARLVDKFMAPSKGIDDASADTGRKKIVFQACKIATPTKASGLDIGGEKVQIGMESVISQLAKDLINLGIESDIDIYGAQENMQMERTEMGVKFTGTDTDSSGRHDIKALQISVHNGQLTQTEVDEILLRK